MVQKYNNKCFTTNQIDRFFSHRQDLHGDKVKEKNRYQFT